MTATAYRQLKDGEIIKADDEIGLNGRVERGIAVPGCAGKAWTADWLNPIFRKVEAKHPGLTKQEVRRWEAAKELFAKLKDSAASRGASIQYQGDTVHASQIVVTDNEICLHCGSSIYLLFSAEPGTAEGLELSLEQYSARIRADFAVVTRHDWWTRGG